MSWRFDGATDWLILNSSLADIQPFTLTMWVYLVVDRNTDGVFYIIADGGGNYQGFDVGSNGTQVEVFTDNGFNGGSNLSTGQWYFLGYVRNGTSHALWLGTASTAVALDASRTESISFTQAAMVLGNNTLGAYINGRIGAPKAWNAALSESELNTEKTYLTPQRSSDLYGYWDSAADYNDDSGNGHNWTQNGTVTFEAQPPVAMQISASDSVTVGESVSISIVTPTGDLAVNVSDNVTVADAATVRLLSFVSASDTLTVGEAAQMLLLDLISVSDSLTVGEAVTLALDDLTVDVSDGVTIGEAVTMLLSSFVDVADEVALGEAVQMLLTSFVDVSDGVTVEDTPVVTLVSDVNATDNVVIGEVVNLAVSDPQIDTADALTIGESVTVIVTAEGTIPVNVSDGIVLSESVSLTVGDPQVNVLDGVTVGDSATLHLLAFIDVADGVVIGETVTVSVVSTGALTVNVSDSITVGESVSLTMPAPLAISVVDSVTVEDQVSMVIASVIIKAIFKAMFNGLFKRMP